MSRVEERLTAIAEMVAVELGTAPAEVALWKELVRAVDMKQLEQTGEIVVREAVLEAEVDSTAGQVSARRKAPDRLHYNPSQVRAVMDQLRRRMRRRTTGAAPLVEGDDVVPVPDVDEPNYDSTDTELWLYGPLN